MPRRSDLVSSVMIKKSILEKFNVTKKQLGFHNSESLIETMLNVLERLKITSKLDLEIFGTYGRLPVIIEGSARSDAEMYEKLGLTKGAKKVAEIQIEPVKITSDVAFNFKETVDVTDPNKKKETKKSENADMVGL